MDVDPARQAIIDEEHLRLLTLGYYVSAGFTVFMSFIGLFYMGLGTVFGAALARFPQSPGKPDELPPAFIGWFFIAFGLAFFLGFGTMAVCKFFVGRNIKRREGKTFCMVIAGLSCLEFPYGTFLGVMTFIVLLRDSVQPLFLQRSAGRTA